MLTGNRLCQNQQLLKNWEKTLKQPFVKEGFHSMSNPIAICTISLLFSPRACKSFAAAFSTESKVLLYIIRPLNLIAGNLILE